LKVKLWQRLDGHSHYVQGVALDPLNKFLLSQSCDRTVAIRTLLTDKGCVRFGLSVCPQFASLLFIAPGLVWLGGSSAANVQPSLPTVFA
jgi:WD40 repeat protein